MWHSMACDAMVWYWCDMAGYGMAWYCMVWVTCIVVGMLCMSLHRIMSCYNIIHDHITWYYDVALQQLNAYDDATFVASTAFLHRSAHQGPLPRARSFMFKINQWYHAAGCKQMIYRSHALFRCQLDSAQDAFGCSSDVLVIAVA